MHRVAMADLKVLFERLGFRDLRTLLNSGDVVFPVCEADRDGVFARIERGLAATLGPSPLLTVLTAREVVAAVSNDPFAAVATNPSHLLVVVPWERRDLRRIRPLLQERWGPEVPALGSRGAYVWCAKGVARSPLGAAVDRALGRMGTVRNIAIFTKASGPCWSTSTVAV